MVQPAGHAMAGDVAVFVGASAVVWFAGSRLVRYVDAIADRTGIGQAFAGMLLLGGITASPEIAAVSGASWLGNAPLSLGNLLGSLCINLVLLAIADATLSRAAITSTVPGPATLLQGTLAIVALALTAAAVAVGDTSIFGVGVWSVLLFAFVIFAFWLSSRYAGTSAWRAQRLQMKMPDADALGRAQRIRSARLKLAEMPLGRLVAQTAGLAVLILLAGFGLSRAADGLAVETGMSAGFVGLVLVGFATALPEFSSIVAAVRLERFEMAISDVFGANLFNLGLILLADALYTGGPILARAGRFEIVAALLGAVLTAVYLMGLLERKDRTIFGMGFDSVAVLFIYAGGLALLYAVS